MEVNEHVLASLRFIEKDQYEEAQINQLVAFLPIPYIVGEGTYHHMIYTTEDYGFTYACVSHNPIGRRVEAIVGDLTEESALKVFMRHTRRD